MLRGSLPFLFWVCCTAQNTTSPTRLPTLSTAFPTTLVPSTAAPTPAPTTLAPTTQVPTTQPTALPTLAPTAQPTALPTLAPTTQQPTTRPTNAPTPQPTALPTAQPTRFPTNLPTRLPTRMPTSSPTVTPAVNSLVVFGGPADSLQAFSQNFSTFSIALNLWPYFRIIPQCAGAQASCVLFGRLASANGTEVVVTNRVVALRDVVGNLIVRTDASISQTITLAPRNGNATIRLKGSQLNRTASFVQYGVFSPYFARTDNYSSINICGKISASQPACPNPVICTTTAVSSSSSVVSLTSSEKSCQNGSLVLDTFFQSSVTTIALPYVVPFTVPRFFQFEYVNPGMTYGYFSSSLASAQNVNSSSILPVFTNSDFNTQTLYFWDGVSAPDPFFTNSPSFEIQTTPMLEPLHIIISSPTSSCAIPLDAVCVMPSQFDIRVVCGTNNETCGVAVVSKSIETNVPFISEVTGTTPLRNVHADVLANLQVEQNVTLSFTTIGNVYTVSLITPYIVHIIGYGSLDNITYAPILLSTDNVIKNFSSSVPLYQFSASRFYRFAFNCSTAGFVLISFLPGVLLPCNPEELTENVYSTPVFQPFFPAAIISLGEEHSTLQYNFQPYVQTINNMVFRGSQNQNGPFSIIDIQYDAKIKFYSLVVPQWFTLTATITPCPQRLGGAVPCIFDYTFDGGHIGYGTLETPPLRMKTLAELNYSSNMTSYPAVTLSVSLPNATTTFALTLSSFCSEEFFYPSSKGPVVCNDPKFINSSCCPCPLFAECKKNSTRPIAIPGYQQSDLWTMVRCDPLSACVGDGKCATGYTDRACSRCDKNADPPHYRVNYECQRCPQDAGIVLILGIMLFLFVLMLFLKISKPDYTKKYTLSITLAFAQIVSIFASFPVNWPLTTLFLFDLFSFLNFNIDLFSPDCAIKMDFFSKWMLKMMLPVICAGVFAIIYALIKLFPKLRKAYIAFMIWDIEERCAQRVDRKRMGEEQKEIEGLWAEMNSQKGNLTREEADRQWEEEHLGERFVHALVTAAVVAYTFLAKTASEPLNCVSQVGGVSHVRADPAAYCDGDWQIYAGISYCAVVVYTVGIPVFFTVVLIRAWRTKTLDDPAFYYKFGHLVLPYRPLFWYWEIVQMSRKLITVLLIEFFTNASGENTKIQINSVLIVLVFFLALQEFAKPYEFSWCNRVAFTWNTFTLIVLMSALLFSFAELSDELAVAYGVALLAAAGFTIFVSLYAFLQELRRARSRRILFVGTNQLVKEKEEQTLLASMFGPNLAKSLHRKTRDLPPTQRNFMYRRLGIWHEQGANSGIEMTGAS